MIIISPLLPEFGAFTVVVMVGGVGQQLEDVFSLSKISGCKSLFTGTNQYTLEGCKVPLDAQDFKFDA